MRNILVSLTLGLVACSGGQKQVAVQAPTEAPPVETKVSDKAQTPSERLGPGEDVSLVVKHDALRPGSKLVAVLEEAVGPQFSREGQLVTARVIPARGENGGAVVPEGTKIILRVGKIQPAMSGTIGLVTLIPRTIQYGDASYPIDARVTAVGLEEPRAGRPVNSTGAPGADVSGSIVKPSDLAPVEQKRDVLGKGTTISLGNTPPNHQLDKGTPMAIELRGPVPLALWTRPGSNELALGWVREITILNEDDLLGKRVEFDKVKVESVIGDVVFWVGPSKDQRVLVVMDQFLDIPETKTVVNKGDTVTVMGVVEAMPPKELAPLLWAMVTDKEAQEFAPYKAYVYATDVKVSKSEPKKAPAKAKRRK
jgi:hypothetical protein